MDKNRKSPLIIKTAGLTFSPSFFYPAAQSGLNLQPMSMGLRPGGVEAKNPGLAVLKSCFQQQNQLFRICNPELVIM